MRRALASDARGLAAIEFALTLPFLVLMFVGCYQLNDAISYYRKMTRTTRTLVDLVAQNVSLSGSDIDSIMSTSSAVMAPYSSSSAQIIISQIKVDANGTGTVDWSQANGNTTALTTGATFTVPSTITQSVKNGYIIVASIKVTYQATLAPSLIASIPLADQAIMIPRASASVRKTS